MAHTQASKMSYKQKDDENAYAFLNCISKLRYCVTISVVLDVVHERFVRGLFGLQKSQL